MQFWFKSMSSFVDKLRKAWMHLVSVSCSNSLRRCNHKSQTVLDKCLSVRDLFFFLRESEEVISRNIFLKVELSWWGVLTLNELLLQKWQEAHDDLPNFLRVHRCYNELFFCQVVSNCENGGHYWNLEQKWFFFLHPLWSLKIWINLYCLSPTLHKKH